MKKGLSIFKNIMVLSLIILILFGSRDFALAEIAKIELDLLRQENLKIRNELIGLKIKVQGKANKLPVLMYHHFLTQEKIDERNAGNNSSIISVESFKSQMDYLYKNDFHTLTLAELEDYLYKGKDLPKRSVLITFDDGYLSNAAYAYPIMKEYGFKGTIFMIGKNTEIEPLAFSPDRLGYLSNQEIHKYTDVFEYECHTYGMHPKVDGKHPLISSLMDEIEEDLKKNRELYNTTAIAYPHGAYNQNLINLLIKENYKLGFAGTPGYVDEKSNPFELKRFGIYPYITIDRFANIVNVK